MSKNTLPTFEARFVLAPDQVTWTIEADPVHIAAAVKAGHAIIVKRNGKTTCRPIVSQVNASTVVVGPKCPIPGTERKTSERKSSKATASAPVTAPVTSKDNAELADLKRALWQAQQTIEALAAQIARQAEGVEAPGTAPVTAPVKASSKREATPAQIAARQAFAERSRARAAERKGTTASAPVTAPVTGVPADLVSAISRPLTACPVCCSPGRPSHVHHGASKITDPVTVRTCKPCAKNVDGEYAIAGIKANIEAGAIK
jgi:hypothetical protein